MLHPNCIMKLYFFINLCISLQGMYDESIRYYVRALAMNPKAENAWQYLRISLRYDFKLH